MQRLPTTLQRLVPAKAMPAVVLKLARVFASSESALVSSARQLTDTFFEPVAMEPDVSLIVVAGGNRLPLRQACARTWVVFATLVS